MERDVTSNTSKLLIAHWHLTCAIMEHVTIPELTLVIQTLNAQLVGVYKDDPEEQRRVILQRDTLVLLRKYMMEQ